MTATTDANNDPAVIVGRNNQTGVATVTLNRPSQRNALSHEMLVALDAAISEIAGDDGIRAVVLTGNGPAFCSGADTRELSGGPNEGPHKPGPGGPEALRRGFELPRKVILGLFDIEKPVIAAIRGSAVGAGLDLACACDIRLATPDARFSAAYVRVGLFPGYGGVWFYPRIFGMAKAAEMMFTGDFIDADSALESGFVNMVVPDEDLLPQAHSMAVRIAAGPPIAIRLAKTMMHRSLGADLQTSLQMSAAAESITLSSQDHAEGMAAARGKRAPVYRGV
ncbi:MAG: enoyl-CoA hydratase-related protein [Chloroflexi bacterium]|nr:enoyl-CoA hydratase-related protein [Chloroflexota bacterium]